MNEIAVKFFPDAAPMGIRLLESVPEVTSVQVVHMLVRQDDIEEEYVTVNTYPAKPARERCRAIVREVEDAYPGAVVSVILEQSPGDASMFALNRSGASAIGIASAVACVKVVWGWDESECFNVLVNDELIRLTVTSIDGGSWSRFALKKNRDGAPPN